MEFDHVLSVRCSVRRYTEEPVSEEDIQKIVKAGEEVPVGHFDFKNYAIAAITDKKVLRLLAEENQALSGRGDPIYGAPLLLLIMNTPEAREDSIKLNAGIMAENMTLNREEGYGKYFQALHLPEGLKPTMAVAVGHTPMVQRERRFVARIPTFRIDGKE